MRKFSMFWLLAVVLIVCIPLVSAVNYEDSIPGLTYGSIGADARLAGVGANFSTSVSIIGFNKTSSSTATRGYLFLNNTLVGGSANISLLATCTFSGNQCNYTVPYNSTITNRTFFFMTDNNGVNRDTYADTSSGFPVAGVPNGLVSFTCGAFNSTSFDCFAANSYEVTSILYSAPTTLGVVFNNPTPSNNSVFYTLSNTNFTVNTTASGFGAYVSTSHYLYNSLGALVSSNTTTTDAANFTSQFLGLTTGTYSINAAVTGVQQKGVYDGTRQGGQTGSFFNGSQYVSSSSAISFSNETTSMEIWFNSNTIPPNNPTIIVTIDGTWRLITAGSSNLALQYATNNSAWASSAFNIVQLNNISVFHVVVTYNASQCLLSGYLNGLNVANKTECGQLLGVPDTLYIGRDSANQRHLNGSIYQVTVFNKSLSASEVSGEYALGPNQPTNLSDGLVLQYLLNRSEAVFSNSSSVFNVNTSTIVSEKRNLYFYDLTSGSITAPTNGSSVGLRFVNFTWTNATINPTASLVAVRNFTLSLYNSDAITFNRTLYAGSQLNLTNFDIYAQNLQTGVYWLRLTSQDSVGNTVTTQSQFNLTTNTRINITAVTALGGTAINSFDGWVYTVETGINQTYSTSSGTAFVETTRGNVTVWINATGYSLLSNTTLVGLNVTTAQYDQIFRLYETNTLNITFYDQAFPTVILNTTTITLDLISDLYANNYSTTNGTMYISLLTPEDYTLRYYANGYTTRFYTVTITNRSFQSINLYLINTSVATNLTITVIDEITDPVEGAQVQVLKYNLPTNTYILQEIVTTGNDGTAIATVTLNNEYYKFIVVFEDEVKLTTNGEYITSTSKTLQISTGSSFGEEFFEYFNFYKDLTFNTATDNFRLDYVDGDGINTQVCMDVSIVSNFSETLINSTCTTGASGTILIGVSAVNGTTYKAYAYFLEDNIEYYLDSEYYTYPSSNVFGTYGLWLQWILTGAMAFMGVIALEFTILTIPLSLWLGNYLGLNQFSLVGLYAIQVTSLIIFVIVAINRRNQG